MEGAGYKMPGMTLNLGYSKAPGLVFVNVETLWSLLFESFFLLFSNLFNLFPSFLSPLSLILV